MPGGDVVADQVAFGDGVDHGTDGFAVADAQLEPSVGSTMTVVEEPEETGAGGFFLLAGESFGVFEFGDLGGDGVCLLRGDLPGGEGVGGGGEPAGR